MPSARAFAAILAAALLSLSAGLGAGAPKLDLRVRVNSGFAPCNAASTVFEPAFRIDNRDSSAVATSTLTLRFWFNSASAISLNWCSNVGVYSSAGVLQGWETVTGARTAISACALGAKGANQYFTLSFTGGLSVPAGGYINVVDHCQFWRGGSAPFDDGCNDYSTETSTSLVQNSTAALYSSGSLLCESASSSPGYDDASTGVDVCTGSGGCAAGTPTRTPTVTLSPTATRTRTATPAPTATLSPTPNGSPTSTISPTPAMGLLKSASVSSATLGDTITFFLNWSNGSSGPVTMRYWDTVPGATSYLGCNNSCSFSGGLVSWSFAAPAGSSGQTAFWVRVTGYP